MKKIILVFLLVITLCLGFLSGCKNTDKENGLNKAQSTNTELSKNEKTSLAVIKHTKIDSNLDERDDGFGGGIITVQKYRSCFYTVPAPFVNLVGRESYYEWINTVDYTESAEKMVMLQFIQHFEITREQFDKANLEIAKIIRNDLDGRPCLNPKDYANQISDEIYNADIIFTFDDTIINEYYLSPDYPYLYSSEYDEAVEKDEYLSQTEEWVDIEQMEEEIIAKYGETEQVDGEQTELSKSVSIPEETTEEKSSENEQISVTENISITE